MNDQCCHDCAGLWLGPDAYEIGLAWKTCEKNCGHTSFIPAQGFCLERLPPRFREATVARVVHCLIPLAVRLRVGYTSRERRFDDCLSDIRGSDATRLGSGRILGVYQGEGACPCYDCSWSSSASPLRNWYRLTVATACHVVYNTREAQKTMVDIFYDDEASHTDGRMTKVWGVEVEARDAELDICRFYASLHDESLAKHLRQCLKLDENDTSLEQDENYTSLEQDESNTSLKQNWHYISLEQDENSINLKERKNFASSSVPGCVPSQRKILCVIVSHPHGQPKQVTVGEVRADHGYCFDYDAATCPGSSGAPLWIFDAQCADPFRVSFPLVPLHSLSLQSEGVNRSTSFYSTKKQGTVAERLILFPGSLAFLIWDILRVCKNLLIRANNLFWSWCSFNLKRLAPRAMTSPSLAT